MKIEIRTSDPTNPIMGQIWFNSTTGLLKGRNNTTTVTITLI
jgi:hypothetical protein